MLTSRKVFSNTFDQLGRPNRPHRNQAVGEPAQKILRTGKASCRRTGDNPWQATHIVRRTPRIDPHRRICQGEAAAGGETAAFGEAGDDHSLDRARWAGALDDDQIATPQAVRDPAHDVQQWPEVGAAVGALRGRHADYVHAGRCRAGVGDP